MNYLENELYLEDVKKVSSDLQLNFKKLKNKKILITGASGLICSFLVDVLMYRNNFYHDNITMYLLCRNEKKLKERFAYYELEKISDNNKSNIIYIIHDIKEKLTYDIKFDYLIHGASNTHPKLYATDPIGTINTNILGLNNILDYCTNKKPERIVMISSVEIYGENKDDKIRFDEESSGYINCNSLRAGYPESKRLGESLSQAYIEQNGLDIVIARLCRVYGPTLLKDDSKALSQFIHNVLHNEDIVLKSEGNQYFSYLYMADVVSAILKIMFDGICGEAYNVSNVSSDIRLKDLAKLLADYANQKVIFDIPSDIEKKGFSKATVAVLDSHKLELLGWKSYYDIKNGLVRTLDILKKMDK